MASSETPPRRRRHWIIWCLGILVALVLIIVFAGPPTVAFFAQSEMQSLIQKHLNAKLVVKKVSYHAPFTLKLEDIEILVPAPNGQELPVLSAASAEIQLGGLPRKNKPLNIKTISVDHPFLHITRTNNGIEGLKGLVKPGKKSGKKKQVSDIFRIGRFTLTGGRIAYADDMHPGNSVTWANLDGKIEARGASGAEYAYDFRADEHPAAQVSAAGTINVDQLVLAISKAQIKLGIEHDADAGIFPPEVLSMVKRYHAGGGAELDGAAHIPLKSAARSTFSAEVRINDFHADQSQWPAPLDRLGAAIDVSRPSPTSQILATIKDITAASGPAVLKMNGGDLAVDLATRNWRIEKIAGFIQGKQSEPSTKTSRLEQIAKRYTILGRIDFTAAAKGAIPHRGQPWPHVTYEALAYARNASCVIPNARAPISRITGGPIEFTDHHGTIQNLQAHYGYDSLQIANARLNLTDPQQGLGVSAIDAEISFDRNSPHYPKPISKFIDELHPEGAFHVIGRCVLYPKPREPNLEYQFSVTTSDMSVAVGPDLFPLDHAVMDIQARTGQIQIRTLSGTVLGGNLNATATVAMGGAIAYDAQGRFSGVDVRKAFEIVQSGGGRREIQPNERVSGKARGRFEVQNTGPGFENLKANGFCGISGADFGGVPILSQLATAVHLSDAAFTGSEAAAVFAISQSSIHLTKFAVSAPAIGIQGTGSISLKGNLDLRAIVAPLSDWRHAIKSTGIPLVGEAAGVVQKLLNKATRTLLYEFSVTGTIKNPAILPVPVPVVTEGIAKIFTGMLQGGPGGLLDAVSGQSTTNKAQQ